MPKPHLLPERLRSDAPTPSAAKLPLQHLEHHRRVAVVGLELERHPQQRRSLVTTAALRKGEHQ